MTRRHILGTLILSAALAGLLAHPGQASAADCGGDYLTCLRETGALGSSDQYHETACYGEYLRCVYRRILMF